MQLVRAPVGSMGVDTDAKLTRPVLAKLRGRGFRFVIRYLSGGAPQPGDLTVAERDDIFAEQLGLMVVQHAPEPGFTPTDLEGRSRGEAAVKHATLLELPKGAELQCDYEGAKFKSTAFLDAWGYQAVAHAFAAKLYVGEGTMIDGAALGALFNFHGYWRSLSRVPEPESRGFQMMQLSGPALVIDGIPFDQNVTQQDFFGGAPHWIAP